jgi:hypothetical protein
MSRIVTVILIYHRHKPTDLIETVVPTVISSSLWQTEILNFHETERPH